MTGQTSLGRDIWLLMAAWTSDMADGRLSRFLKLDHSTWLSNNDVYVDMFVSAAILFYMTVSGLLALWLVLIYLVVWSMVFLRYGIPPLFAQVFQNPIYAFFVFFTVQAEPWVLPWLLLWAVVMLAFFWQRAVELYNNTVRKLRG
jgi:cardiolipin synthase (CMP-forming)